MERRNFLRGMAALAVCPLCAGPAAAAEAVHHWSYEGEGGPSHWGALDKANLACSAGSQQSPVNIAGPVKATLQPIATAWKKGGGKVVNNGHTIQINMPAGSKLTRGDKTYEMLQFHFHAPSEHLVGGKSFPMEVHFVHKNTASNDLGVLGVFLIAGKANPTFASLAVTFPAKEGGEAAAGDLDLTGMLPAKLRYWAYEGSLTTPPCSEIVDWMVAMDPIEVAAADIARFTALYKMNARPALAANRRFVLASE